MRWASTARLWRDDGPMGKSLAAVVLAAAWVATWRPQVDPDAWWHIAIGETIVAAGAIPSTEPFSWLTAGERFVAHSWVWDVLLASAWRAGGPTGTSLLVLPVTALIVALVWQLLEVSAPRIAPLPRAVLVLAAVAVTFPSWAPRAQTLDIAFVLATMLVLSRYLHLGTRRELIALPLLAVLWANLHGSAILAFAICMAIAVVALPVGVRWGTWPWRSRGPILVAGSAGIAAMVVNPYGPWLLAYPFDRAVASAFSPAIVEWRPPDFGAVELLPLRVLLGAGLLVAVWLPARSRDPFLLLAAAAWTFAALGSARFVSISGPLLVVALAPAIWVALDQWLRPVTTPSDGGAAEERAVTDAVGEAPLAARARPGPAVAIAAVALAVILAAGWLIIDPPRQEAAIERRLPVAALSALETSACEGRLLPAYGWAGYVIWATGRPVGAYGNSAEAAVSAQAQLEAMVVDPGPWLGDHAVDVVLMPAGGALSHWLDEADGWRLAYRDPQATVHVRADATDCPLSSSPTP